MTILKSLANFSKYPNDDVTPLRPTSSAVSRPAHFGKRRGTAIHRTAQSPLQPPKGKKLASINVLDSTFACYLPNSYDILFILIFLLEDDFNEHATALNRPVNHIFKVKPDTQGNKQSTLDDETLLNHGSSTAGNLLFCFFFNCFVDFISLPLFLVIHSS